MMLRPTEDVLMVMVQGEREARAAKLRPAPLISARPNANIIHEKWRSIRICREEMENLVPNSMNNLNKAMQ